MKLGTICQVKTLFLDRAAVQRRLDQATLKLLRRVGGKTRLRAQQKIRNPPQSKRRQKGPKRRRGPYNRTGKLKGNIFFSLDPRLDTVITGPIKFKGSGNQTIPELLEYGGIKQTKAFGPVEYDEFPFMRPAHEEIASDIDRELQGMVK